MLYLSQISVFVLNIVFFIVETSIFLKVFNFYTLTKRLLLFFQLCISYRLMKFKAIFFFIITCFHQAFSCTCDDFEKLSKQECGKYEVIFSGTVLEFFPCQNEKGKVVFSIQELYKGDASLEQEVFFECKNNDCPVEFVKGEEWLLFAKPHLLKKTNIIKTILQNTFIT